MIKKEKYSAAILVIGDEILSGRTQDTNSNYIAKELENFLNFFFDANYLI